MSVNGPQHQLCFAQLIANKKKNPILNLLNNHHEHFDIFLIEEPNWSFTGQVDKQVIFGTVDHATAWSPVHPSPMDSNEKAPRVYAFIKKGIDAEVTLCSDIIADRNIQILDVTTPDGVITTYVHVYNDPTLGRQQILWSLQNLNLPLHCPMVITGDFNLHHPRWWADAHRECSLTQEIVDWLDNHDFTLLNELGIPTHHPHDRKKCATVIDLTWVNSPTIQHDIIKEWAVDDSIADMSDHIALKWTQDSALVEIQNITGEKYSMKDTEEKDWVAAFDEGHPL
jgi:hypothetical protein